MTEPLDLDALDRVELLRLDRVGGLYAVASRLVAELEATREERDLARKERDGYQKRLDIEVAAVARVEVLCEHPTLSYDSDNVPTEVVRVEKIRAALRGDE